MKRFVEIMVEEGIRPEAARDFLKSVVKTERANFERIRPMLAPDDALRVEMQILNGEILLSIFKSACV